MKQLYWILQRLLLSLWIPAEINVELLVSLLKDRFIDFLNLVTGSYVDLFSKLRGTNVPKE